jgi:predicted ATPase|tara:strand:+ start:3827 stop:4585 length:759 start_codon:yes stop_codon:yes gene_type:complete
MRIAFSGTGNSGKTTLLKSFLYTWVDYTTPEKTYREMLKEEKLPHSSKLTTQTQTSILDFMVNQVQSTDKDDNIAYDRCPLDAIAYSMWGHDKGIEGFTKEFVTKQINLMKESMRSLDIIFLCRFDPNQVVKDDGFRDTDKTFITEVDNIFYSLYRQYTEHPEADIFFPKGDSPGIILLPDKGQERIDLIGEYITPEGSMYGDEESIFSPKNLNELEELVKQQQAAHKAEEKEKELKKRFGLPDGGYPPVTL